MKVMMFGWEFPPYNVGGLGTACAGLTKGLADHGVDVLFVLPKAPGAIRSRNAKVLVADHECRNIPSIKRIEINSLLAPYQSEVQYASTKNSFEVIGNNRSSHSTTYGKDIYQEVNRFAEQARHLAEKYSDCDVIHAHDWMTYPAGLLAKKATGKPLVVHIHATEFDRTNNSPNEYIYNIEKEGMGSADLVLAVSDFTKQKVMQHYGIPDHKIRVVHNGVEFNDNSFSTQHGLKKDNKVVLFLGRITIQKGPEHFLWAARKVVDIDPSVRFIMVGGGDMENYVIEKAAELGLSKYVLFAGPLRGKQVDEAYQMADLYIMPSLSEPFGITPLESMRNGTPVLISKQSGVSEVLNHALKVDFWDIDEMTNKIIASLKYSSLHRCLIDNGAQEVRNITWQKPAELCMKAYSDVVNQAL